MDYEDYIDGTHFLPEWIQEEVAREFEDSPDAVCIRIMHREPHCWRLTVFDGAGLTIGYFFGDDRIGSMHFSPLYHHDREFDNDYAVLDQYLKNMGITRGA